MSINKIMTVTEVFVSKNLVNIKKKSRFACYLATCRLFFQWPHGSHLWSSNQIKLRYF